MQKELFVKELYYLVEKVDPEKTSISANIRNRASQCCNCKFLICASFNAEIGLWYIIVAHLEHSHTMETDNHNHFMSNERTIPLEVQEKILLFHCTGYSPFIIHSILKEEFKEIPGYYGTRGMNIKTEELNNQLFLHTCILTNKLSYPKNPVDYILEIMVPEMALRLISQDKGGITLEEARKIIEDSSTFGDYVHEE
ncbi:5193_t:CDS:2 [Diversispora eburnea]|uniref:Restriction of telomere capping protein 4 n=1 Tax=Diversispora eburnea TaxID=1213867 RepID=A0A9N9BLY6_9GLOM|nr:5193_t:CDS:2 [Diversispora eburnea]